MPLKILKLSEHNLIVYLHILHLKLENIFWADIDNTDMSDTVGTETEKKTQFWKLDKTLPLFTFSHFSLSQF